MPSMSKAADDDAGKLLQIQREKGRGNERE
jgi:hypothetical protein